MSNELNHHGVLGQKWGKKNGPPYPLDVSGKAAVKRQRKESKRDAVRKMSDEELNKKITRLRKENEYLELTEKNVKRGRNFVENLAIDGGAMLVTALVTTGAKKSGEAIVANVLNKKLSSAAFNAIYKKK